MNNAFFETFGDSVGKSLCQQLLEEKLPKFTEPRYDVLILNVKDKPGAEASMQTVYWPTYRELKALSEQVGIDVSDFEDIDNALRHDIKEVWGKVISISGKAVADFVVTKLTDTPVYIKELYR